MCRGIYCLFCVSAFAAQNSWVFRSLEGHITPSSKKDGSTLRTRMFSMQLHGAKVRLNSEVIFKGSDALVLNLHSSA